jgi:peptidoglycan LD-endopeptidase LytH
MQTWQGRLRLGGAIVVLGATVWVALAMRGLPNPPAQSAPRTELAADKPTEKPDFGPYTPDSSLIIPVQGVRANQLTDTFTQARENGARVHDAIDIIAPRGTPVLAATAGAIEKLYLSRAGGRTIYQRSRDRRTIYYYAHLDGYAAGLAEGQVVPAGQQIGVVGFSGNANPLAPHLHFAILQTDPAAPWYRAGAAINPYPLLTR